MEGTPEVNEPSKDNKSREDISFYTAHLWEHTKGSHLSTHAVADASVDSNQVFTRPGQGLSSSTFSNANTHISLKVNC